MARSTVYPWLYILALVVAAKAMDSGSGVEESSDLNDTPTVKGLAAKFEQVDKQESHVESGHGADTPTVGEIREKFEQMSKSADNHVLTRGKRSADSYGSTGRAFKRRNAVRNLGHRSADEFPLSPSSWDGVSEFSAEDKFPVSPDRDDQSGFPAVTYEKAGDESGAEENLESRTLESESDQRRLSKNGAEDMTLARRIKHTEIAAPRLVRNQDPFSYDAASEHPSWLYQAWIKYDYGLARDKLAGADGNGPFFLPTGAIQVPVAATTDELQQWEGKFSNIFDHPTLGGFALQLLHHRYKEAVDFRSRGSLVKVFFEVQGYSTWRSSIDGAANFLKPTSGEEVHGPAIHPDFHTSANQIVSNAFKDMHKFMEQVLSTGSYNTNQKKEMTKINTVADFFEAVDYFERIEGEVQQLLNKQWLTSYTKPQSTYTGERTANMEAWEKLCNQQEGVQNCLRHSGHYHDENYVGGPCVYLEKTVKRKRRLTKRGHKESTSEPEYQCVMCRSGPECAALLYNPLALQDGVDPTNRDESGVEVRCRREVDGPALLDRQDDIRRCYSEPTKGETVPHKQCCGKVDYNFPRQVILR